MTPPPPRGLKARQARRAAMHARVVQGAIQLFMAKGYDRVTVEEIAAAAGISRRSFFRHFQQKEEVLIRWMARFNEQYCEGVARQPPELSLLETLRRGLEATDEMGPGGSDGASMRLLFSLVADSAAARTAMANAQAGWEAALAQALRRRDPAAPEVELRLAAGVALAAMRAACEAWLAAGGDPGGLPACLDAAFGYVADLARRP